MRKGLWVFCILFAFSLVPCAVSGQTIVLKAVTAFPKTHLNNDPVPAFVEAVNKRAQGKLRIDWLGGPEVFAAFDQGTALKSGTVDMLLYYPFGYMKGLMPEADAKGLSELAEWEERKTGAFELWGEIFEKRVNAKYLGKLHNNVTFNLFCNKKIDKLADFKGLKIRVMPLYIPFIKSLGASPVTMPPTDIYTGMERGVVDGFMWPRVGMISWGLQEVTKFMIEPGVFQMEPATAINMDRWKKIPQDLQAILTETIQEHEYIATARNYMILDKEERVREKAGMKIIKLSPADAEAFVKAAYDNTWAEVVKSAPDYGPKLRKASSKAAVPKGTFPWQ
jgi:TRAP-type C4-dicarboxylate transport system substrate-binding protein